MTALEELQNDKLGDEFLWVLQRTIRAVAVARNFPAPEGHRRWEENAVAQSAADFLSDPGTPRRLTDLATHCRTDHALKLRLQATVRNYLADNGRRTPVGRLVLRFNEVLERDDRFERRGRAWALAGTHDEVAAVDLDALVVVSAGVEVIVPSAWTTGTRQSPDIDAPSVANLAEALLRAAGGSLSASVLGQVTARRLGVGGAPLSIDASAFDPPDLFSPPDTTGTRVLKDIYAAEVFSLLNDAERVSIGAPHAPVAELGILLGSSGSSAALVRKRAIAVLRRELADDEDGQSVADAVLDLARSWTESWMSATDPTY